TISGLSMVQGSTYYATVRAVNEAGLTSTTASTARGDGFKVDTTAPSGVGSLTITTNEAEHIVATWNAASDAESGIAEYEYCISSTDNCTGTKYADFTSTGTTTSFDDSSVELGSETTY